MLLEQRNKIWQLKRKTRNLDAQHFQINRVLFKNKNNIFILKPIFKVGFKRGLKTASNVRKKLQIGQFLQTVKDTAIRMKL